MTAAGETSALASKGADDWHAEAEAALARNPGDVDARANLARALRLLGRYNEADAEYEKTLAAAPAHPHAIVDYCALLECGTDGLSRIEAVCNRALEADENCHVARLSQARAYAKGLQADRGLRLMEELLHPEVTRGPLQRSVLLAYLFALGYTDTITPERMTRAIGGARAWLRRHFSGAAMPPEEWTERVASKANKPPLKVGVLCSDVYRHPIGELLASFLPEIDADRFSVTLYDFTSPHLPDPVMEYLRGAGGYVGLNGLDAMSAVQRIRQDGIQLALDTASITSEVIVEVLAHRCAPTQLTWGGWVYSHPLETVDGFIGDRVTIFDTHLPQFLQPVYRLPGCVYAYRPIERRPAPTPLPALTNGYVSFGSFNNLSKVNAGTLDLWAAVLLAVPDSRLVVKASAISDCATRDRLADGLERRGVAPARLMLGLPSPYEEYLEDFARVDMLLDCVPFNGGMTTIQGLWQGVPTLALAGTSHASRVGMSLMHAAGLDDWIAADADRYVQLARSMSQKLSDLSELRASLPLAMSDKRLGSVKQFAREMGEIWEMAVQ